MKTDKKKSEKTRKNETAQDKKKVSAATMDSIIQPASSKAKATAGSRLSNEGTNVDYKEQR